MRGTAELEPRKALQHVSHGQVIRIEVARAGSCAKQLARLRGHEHGHGQLASRFFGHLPALLSRRVPVQAVAVADGVVFGHPEPEASPPRFQRTAGPRRLALPQLPPAIHETSAIFG